MFERDEIGFEASESESEARDEEYLHAETSPQVVNSRRLRLIGKISEDGVSEKNDMAEAVDVALKKKKYRMIRRLPAKIFDCTECGKTFKHPSKIAEHMRVHTGEKPYRCELCGAGFSQGNSLKVHLRMHRGERPYPCDYCDRDFPTSSQKKSHEKTHLKKPGAEPLVYVCPAEGCNARYARKERMAYHIQTSHPELGEVVEEVEEKRIVINTVEDLIERVNEPDDVREEPTWEHSIAEPDYYSEIVVEDDGTHLEEAQCYAPVNESAIVTLVKEGSGEVLVSGISDTAEFIEEHEGRMHEETFVLSTCAVNPTIVKAELPDAVAIEGEEAEQIFVAGEEIVNDEQCSSGIVCDYVCDTEDAYYEAHTEEQASIAEGSVLAAETEGDLDSEDEILVDGGDPMVEGPSGSFVNGIHDFEYVAVESPPLPPPPVITRKRRLKRLEQGLLAGTHHLELEPLTAKYMGISRGVNSHRVVADPRPPRKGRRRNEIENSGFKLEVDSAIFEMAAPVKRTREVTERLMYVEDYICRPARNLDWIIEAVARGEDVDKASPHNRRKPQIHRCEFCGRLDKYPSKIKAHMRTHTGEKPFECDICGMKFAQRTPMRMHVRRHLNQKPYVCDVNGCGERFINGSLLNVHQNLRHFERKRYACMRGCGRSFAQIRDQRKHEVKCTHKIALKVGYEEAYRSGVLPRGYDSAPTLRGMAQEENLGSVEHKYELKMNACAQFIDTVDERHQLPDGEQFLEDGEEPHELMENHRLDEYNSRLAEQNMEAIGCADGDTALEEINLNTIKVEGKPPDTVFDDTRQLVDGQVERSWLL